MPSLERAAGPTRRLLPYFARHQRALVLGFLCILATTAIQLLSPWVLKYAIDDLTAGVTRGKLAFYAAALFGVALVGGFFRFLMRKIVIGVSRHMEYDLRQAFFAHLQTLPPAFYQANRTGDLMSRATNDLNAVRMMAGPSVMYATQTALTFVVAVLLMASIDPWLTMVAVAPLPIISVAVKLFGSAIHRRFERIQAQLSELSAVAQENLSGVRVLRAYGQEAAELDKFRAANEEYISRNRGLIRLQGAFFPSLTLLLGLGAMLVLWLGSREVIAGRMTVGDLVAFNAYFIMLSWPMIAFGWVANMLQRGTASWKRMLELLDTPPTIADPAAPVDLPAGGIVGRVEFDGLTLEFDGRAVLDDVRLTIEPGQTVAIVGPTGSGKSMLLATLPRLVDPPSGTVRLDGIDVRQLRLETLRAAIAVAPQEPFLFSDTLDANIAFAPEVASLPPEERRRRVEAAAALARLDKDVESFPAGYDTTVGERGITLSGGQKQRTSLARALIADPRVLILDDALSAVDTYTEDEILHRLREVRRGRTCLIVSHRVSTVRDADQIVVLDQGRIVERGTHDELVGHGGTYAELHKRQLLEDELTALED
jgi:ATP-binding cassette subfamily B multidrug efflux pump